MTVGPLVLSVLSGPSRVSRRWLSAAVGGLLLALAVPAAAKYQVDIDAPPSVSKLLKQHLDLARFAKRDDITDD
jgi:translocation and assembly module TamA